MKGKRKILKGIYLELKDPIKRWAWIFMLPGILSYLIFYFYPILRTFYLSFHVKRTLFEQARFIGIKNFIYLFKEPDLLISIVNTFYYILLTLPSGTFLAIFTALLLVSINSKLFKSFFKTIYFLPVVAGVVIVTIIWRWMFLDDIGLLNYLLKLVGIASVGWLTDRRVAMISVAILVVWRTLGFNILIFIAGLVAIPNTYYEAAKIDGAGKITCFGRITLPLLSPTTWFVLINSTIGLLQTFAEVFLLTKGGPATATRTIAFTIYHTGFRYGNHGLASAGAVVLLFLVFTITFINVKVMNRTKIEY